MFDRRDRKDLALLALQVVVFGIVLGPVAHRVLVHGRGSGHGETEALSFAHDERVPHHHHHDHGQGPAGPHHHGAFDPTHLGFAAVPPMSPAATLVLWATILPPPPHPPAWVPNRLIPRFTEVPQGP